MSSQRPYKRLIGITRRLSTVTSSPRQQQGRELIIYGHGRLGQTLLQHHLLDEVHLSVHPVLMGCGKLLFREGAMAQLELVSANPRRNGVVVLSYKSMET